MASACSVRGVPAAKWHGICEVLDKSGLVSSPLEERVRFMNALSDGIALTLNMIPGVLNPRVHVVPPDNDPYAERIAPSYASVLLTQRWDPRWRATPGRSNSRATNRIEGLDFDSLPAFPHHTASSPKHSREPIRRFRYWAST